MASTSEAPRTVLVTGISGNLGGRLLPLLSGFNVVGVDMRPPEVSAPSLTRFESIDLGQESACPRLVELIRDTNVSAVVHLAFVIDPIRTGVIDVPRMWQINVAGTARVMEAITEVNRHGGSVTKFIFPSSVSAYGPDLPEPVDEDAPLNAHTLPYAVHKKESDEVVRARAPQMRDCSTYILRPHIYAGASIQNYLVGSIRGTPTGKGLWGVRLRERGTRLPMLLPFGQKYLDNNFQFVHVDDVARLILFLLRRPADPPLVVLNVAGRGPALTMRRCAEIAHAKVTRLPGRLACRLMLRLMWDLGISAVPPAALPYIVGSYTMRTDRLQQFLGLDYERVIRYTNEEALADSFRPVAEPAPEPEPSLSR